MAKTVSATALKTKAPKVQLTAEEKKLKWKRFARSFTKNWQVYLLLLPVVAYYVIFHYAPMYGLQIAFRDYNPVEGFWGSTWVGLKHFLRFFSSYNAGRLISNTLILSVLSLAINFPLTIIFALMLNEVRSIRFKRTVQTITYAPHFISVVVVVSMLILFTHADRGIINFAIKAFGGEPIRFMERPEWFRPLYIISGIWQSMGFSAIIYIAALAGIDQELIEAACVDGAGRFRRIWHINIPGILPTVVTMLILNVGSIMSVGFEKIFLMQNDLNKETSDVIATYTYQVGIINGQMSFSSAIGLFNSVINCILLLSVNSISKKLSDTSLW